MDDEKNMYFPDLSVSCLMKICRYTKLMMLNLIKETMIDLNGPLSRSIAQIFKKKYVGAVGSVCAVQAFVDNENLQIYQIDDAESDKRIHD